MALPALLGLPAAISFAGAMGYYIFQFAIKYLTKKVLIISVLITALGLLLNGLMAYASTQMALAFSTIPSLGFVPYFIPDNLVTCVSLVLGSDLVVMTYSLSTRFARDKAFIMSA